MEAENDPIVPAPTVQGKVTGIIYPPPDIRAIVDKTAQFVARSGRSFERKIASSATGNQFAFLNESDPYHAYYEHKIVEFTEKSNASESAAPAPTAAAPAPAAPVPTIQSQSDPATPVVQTKENEETVIVSKEAVETVTAKVAKKIREKTLVPPDEEKFKIKHPHLSALDQEIMYVTAQYTALSGKSFLAGLATREQRNPQFDFLKPTHALFAYFTALVESYALVLSKSDDQMKRIEDGLDRMKVLDRCVHKLEWIRREQEQKDREAAENDAERLAASNVDWHDFIVVEKITFNDEEEAAALAAQTEEQSKQSDDEDMDMDDDDDDDGDDSKPQIKVVQNYVPLASTQPAASSAPTMMTVDGKAVSSAEANEHMRILLMNPKWREETQRHLEKQKESSYAAGSAIADSLKRFAGKRADIFSSSADEEARLQRARDAPSSTTGGSHVEQTVAQSVPEQAAPGPTPFPPFMPPGAPGFPPGMAPPGIPHPGMGPPGMSPFGFPPGGFGGQMPPGFPPGAMPGPPGVAPSVHAGPPGVGGPPGMAPPGVDMTQQPTDLDQPASKRQRTEGASLLTEQEFAALHPGNVRLTIKVLQDPENAQWNLNGQTITVEIDVLASMRFLKEKLATDLGGMPVNKQQLKASVGFLKDTLSSAHYNFVNGTVLELTARQRGGRR